MEGGEGLGAGVVVGGDCEEEGGEEEGEREGEEDEEGEEAVECGFGAVGVDVGGGGGGGGEEEREGVDYEAGFFVGEEGEEGDEG